MRHQITCRCDRVIFPHRREWRCDEWADSVAGIDDDNEWVDNRDRQRDCEAVRTEGSVWK